MCMYIHVLCPLQGGGVDGMVTPVTDVQSQELAGKISENAQLHLTVRTCITDE